MEIHNLLTASVHELEQYVMSLDIDNEQLVQLHIPLLRWFLDAQSPASPSTEQAQHLLQYYSYETSVVDELYRSVSQAKNSPNIVSDEILDMCHFEVMELSEKCIIICTAFDAALGLCSLPTNYSTSLGDRQFEDVLKIITSILLDPGLVKCFELEAIIALYLIKLPSVDVFENYVHCLLSLCSTGEAIRMVLYSIVCTVFPSNELIGLVVRGALMHFGIVEMKKFSFAKGNCFLANEKPISVRFPLKSRTSEKHVLANVLYSLATLDKFIAAQVRDTLTECKSLPNICFKVTCNIIDDAFLWLRSIFDNSEFGDDSIARNIWDSKLFNSDVDLSTSAHKRQSERFIKSAAPVRNHWLLGSLTGNELELACNAVCDYLEMRLESQCCMNECIRQIILFSIAGLFSPSPSLPPNLKRLHEILQESLQADFEMEVLKGFMTTIGYVILMVATIHNILTIKTLPQSVSTIFLGSLKEFELLVQAAVSTIESKGAGNETFGIVRVYLSLITQFHCSFQLREYAINALDFQGALCLHVHPIRIMEESGEGCDSSLAPGVTCRLPSICMNLPSSEPRVLSHRKLAGADTNSLNNLAPILQADTAIPESLFSTLGPLRMLASSQAADLDLLLLMITTFQSLPMPSKFSIADGVDSLYSDFWLRTFAVLLGCDVFRRIRDLQLEKCQESVQFGEYVHDIMLRIVDNSSSPLHPYVQACIDWWSIRCQQPGSGVGLPLMPWEIETRLQKKSSEQTSSPFEHGELTPVYSTTRSKDVESIFLLVETKPFQESVARDSSLISLYANCWKYYQNDSNYQQNLQLPMICYVVLQRESMARAICDSFSSYIPFSVNFDNIPIRAALRELMMAIEINQRISMNDRNYFATELRLLLCTVLLAQRLSPVTFLTSIDSVPQLGFSIIKQHRCLSFFEKPTLPNRTTCPYQSWSAEAQIIVSFIARIAISHSCSAPSQDIDIDDREIEKIVTEILFPASLLIGALYLVQSNPATRRESLAVTKYDQLSCLLQRLHFQHSCPQRLLLLESNQLFKINKFGIDFKQLKAQLPCELSSMWDFDKYYSFRASDQQSLGLSPNQVYSFDELAREPMLLLRLNVDLGLYVSEQPPVQKVPELSLPFLCNPFIFNAVLGIISHCNFAGKIDSADALMIKRKSLARWKEDDSSRSSRMKTDVLNVVPVEYPATVMNDSTAQAVSTTLAIADCIQIELFHQLQEVILIRLVLSLTEAIVCKEVSTSSVSNCRVIEIASTFISSMLTSTNSANLLFAVLESGLSEYGYSLLYHCLGIERSFSPRRPGSATDCFDTFGHYLRSIAYSLLVSRKSMQLYSTTKAENILKQILWLSSDCMAKTFGGLGHISSSHALLVHDLGMAATGILFSLVGSLNSHLRPVETSVVERFIQAYLEQVISAKFPEQLLHCASAALESSAKGTDQDKSVIKRLKKMVLVSSKHCFPSNIIFSRVTEGVSLLRRRIVIPECLDDSCNNGVSSGEKRVIMDSTEQQRKKSRILHGEGMQIFD